MQHPDLDQLLNSLLSFAKRKLADHGEFPPFGGTVKPDGEIVAVGAYDGDKDLPSQSAINLTSTFRAQARTGQIRAAAICYDARTTPPGRTAKCDAVCTSMEHQSGEAVNVILPYERTNNGDVQYGQMFTTDRIPQFFVPNETSVGGWLLLLCLGLTCVNPATTLYRIFSYDIPSFFNPHIPLRYVVLFITYSVLFIPLAIFSFIAGMKLWLVKPGAVRFARRYLFTFLSAHIAYFFLWVLWLVIVRPNQPGSFVAMCQWHVVNPTLFVALWYFYLKRSWRVRTLYVLG